MKAMTFFGKGARDSSDVYINALLSSGYTRTEDMRRADFILWDKEPTLLHKRERLKKLIGNKPIFVFPHTPYAYWLWDGFLEPMPVCCNFVVGEGAKMGMKSYGYPYRVEAVGFPRCKVLPFQSTSGRNLLYASARLLGNQQFPHEADLELHLQAMRWIAAHREAFDGVMINYSYSLEANVLEEFAGYGLTFRKLEDNWKLSAHTALDQFQGADLVISCNTFGYLAIANGIPTILFGHNDRVGPHSSKYLCPHYELYKSHYEFPLFLQDMTAKEVLDIRTSPNPEVEKWKELNIGKSFEAEKFISIVKEYL
jgi:hypothetical protein